MIQYRNMSDLIAGGAVIILGVFFGLISLNYPFGSIANIGPGIFPFGLSVILVILGAGIILFSMPPDSDEEASAVNWRATAAIGFSFLAFSFLIISFGLVPAVVVSVAITRLAEPDFRLRTVLALSGGLAVLCWLIFIIGLNVPVAALRWPF